MTTSTYADQSAPDPVAAHCRLNRAVTFARGTRHEFTLAAGSIVLCDPLLTEQARGDLPHTQPLRVEFAGRFAVVDMDDASPVEWDDTEQRWTDI